MTLQRACQLLGVTATSTLKQIKAAYRRKVSQCHPDRLEDRANEVRQLATEQTAAINDAYRLLRSALI
jgi:DnaJ like chaperone protein